MPMVSYSYETHFEREIQAAWRHISLSIQLITHLLFFYLIVIQPSASNKLALFTGLVNT